MLDFLGKRLQKTINKMKTKMTLTEEDILEITREIKMSLLEADVNLMVVKKFISSVKDKIVGSQLIGKLEPSEQMIKIVNEELVKILGNKTSEISLDGKLPIVMMVGLQGSGKTTTAAKLAKHFMKKHDFKKPLMVAGDIYRPAAIDQLITLGKELQIDVFSKGDKVNPRIIVEEAIKFAKTNENDLIIIDTAGRLAIDTELMNELYDIKKIANPNEIFFVADALSGQDIINVATEFNKKLSLTGTIITKLDSDARGGAALSITHLLKVPVKFIGTGEKVSNLDVFHPDRMANRILGMGDVMSILEKAEEVIDEKGSKRMISRMAAGKFDLTDLMQQLDQMKQMGKMSKLIKMIPGLNGKISEDRISNAEKKFDLFEIMISSMTIEERKNPKLLKIASRKQRIMKGSGRSAQEYNSLINEFDRMAKQMKEMSKKMQNGTFDPSMLGGIG